MKTIIQNGIVVTMDQQMQVWDHGYVIIDGTKIVEAGPESELELKKAAGPGGRKLAGKGCMQRHHYAGNGQYPQPLRDDPVQGTGR